MLSGADGLTIADGSGSVTITASDSVVPDVSAQASVSVTEADPGAGGDGWLSTSGSDIVDRAGNVMRITAVNWFGGETVRMAPDGLETRNYKDMMDQMKAVGFNAIRLPFSNDMLRDGATPTNIDANANPELANLTSLEVMDAVIDYADEIGLRIILDNHRNAAGNGASSNGLWYGEGYSQAEWIADWEMLAGRYQDDPTVVAVDLSNEPHSADWGSGDPATDWRLGAEAAIDAIHDINPNVLVLVEGIGGNYWWGGDLTGVADDPIRLEQTDKLVYSPHAYPNSIYPQPWFSEPGFPDNLPSVWDQNFGYIAEENIAPVLVGEFGSKFEDPKDLAWMDAFIPYVVENDLSYAYWSWNPNSGDTGGIVSDDWTTVRDNKVAALQPSFAAPIPAGDGGSVVDVEP